MINNKIFIVLTSSYLEKIIPYVEKGDVVLTDLYCPYHKGKTINPNLNSIEQEELSISTKKVFNYYFSGGDNENIEYGYVNNFYECTIYPIVKYIFTLERFLKSSKVGYLFCMEKRTLLNYKTPTI